MKRTTILLLLALLLSSCHTCRTAETESKHANDTTHTDLARLDIVAIDSLLTEFDFAADRLNIQFLPSGETNITADKMNTKGTRKEVCRSASSQQHAECSSHNIRDSTATKRDREAVVITEPPDTNHLLPLLAVSIAVIGIAYLALKKEKTPNPL